MKEELFDDLILERGYEYAQEGAVDHVRKVGEVIYATVHGTEDYHVKIDDNDMFCDCPYAKEGAHCKHMAAVLYYLDTHPVYDEHTIIDALSEKQAKQLLKKILKDHPEYLDQLPQVEKKVVIKESVEEVGALNKAVKLNCGFVDRLCNGMSLEECKREAIRAARKEISENRNVQIIKAGK